MKNKYGIDTDAAMDEMSPPQHESGKMGGMGGAKKDGHMPGHHSPHAAPMKGSEHAPMPMHSPGSHPLSHYEKMKK